MSTLTDFARVLKLLSYARWTTQIRATYVGGTKGLLSIQMTGTRVWKLGVALRGESPGEEAEGGFINFVMIRKRDGGGLVIPSGFGLGFGGRWERRIGMRIEI